MKPFTIAIGVLLIALGSAIFIFKGVSYTTQENVVQVGELKITANTQKTVDCHWQQVWWC
jgi:hypothetical protein